MSNFNMALITFALILFLQSNIGAEGRSLKFSATNSNFNPEYLSNFTMYILNNTLSVEGYLIRPIVAGSKAKLEYQVRLENSKAYQTLLDYNTDICTVLNAYKNSLLKKYYKSIRKYSNFAQSCPMPVGRYYMNRWYVEPNLIPAYMFSGDYRAKCYVYTTKNKSKNENFILNASIDATITDN